MAIENYCISDLDLPVSRSGKRQRVSSESSPHWDLPLKELRRRSRKRQRRITNSETISKIGDDLLVEILIRGLPNPRSACRSKLVCKRWSSLLSGPRFNRRFVAHHQTMSLNHPPMPDDPYELLSIIVSFLPPMPNEVRDTLRVLDCYKDLVLCGFWDKFHNGEPSRSYLVCNPFTKEWIALPLAPRKSLGYHSPYARLVCEPRISTKLDLGDDDQAFVYSEYRFRVVCMCKVSLPNPATKLDVFCSESGEWTQEALVREYHYICGNPISCNGELFWPYYENRDGDDRDITLLARFNPFRLDIPPTKVDVSAFLAKPRWYISKSLGALYLLVLENGTVPVRSSVWRLDEEEDDSGTTWSKQCEGLVKNTTSNGCNYEVKGCSLSYLHPHNPEIVFFNCTAAGDDKNVILCCDLRREELEFLAEVEGLRDIHRIQVFQPRVSCWPTPIPRYEELRGVYDGTYSFWVQSSCEAKTPPLPPSLNNCMDRVLKSASYKDYIEGVAAEATLHMVTKIISRRQNKIGSKTARSRKRRPRSPILDDEWDVLEADLADVQADMNILMVQKEELEQALVQETAELSYPPPGPIKSFFRQEPSRWGVKHIMGMVMRHMHLPS